MTNNKEGESDIGMAIGASSPRQVVCYFYFVPYSCQRASTPSSLCGRGSRGSSVLATTFAPFPHSNSTSLSCSLAIPVFIIIPQ